MSLSPLEAARTLAPLIRSSAPETDAQRELPRPLFEAMADAGLFQLALPRTLGGAEMDLPSYIQVIEELGRADASTAWVTNQVSIFATYAARMETAAARAIWLDTPRSVVAVLLAAGADPTVRDPVLGCTPEAFGLCTAASWAWLSKARQRLAENPALVRAESRRGGPLHEAAWTGSLEIVKLLVEAGADPGWRNEDGKTALDLARERPDQAGCVQVASG